MALPFKEIFALAILLVLALVTIIFLSPSETSDNYQVCFGENCFKVEIADSLVERTSGLASRQSLGTDRGMLFIFEEDGVYPFWMKNTLIPLDIIWMNENREVVYTYQNAQPCEDDFCIAIDPETSARYVLELNAGAVSEISLQIGDTLDFNL